MLSVEEVKTLKVADLRKELKQRGLDTTGKKDELAKRLADAVEEENLLGDVGSGDAAEPAAPAASAAAPTVDEPVAPAKASPVKAAAPAKAATTATGNGGSAANKPAAVPETTSATADDILGAPAPASTTLAGTDVAASAETATAEKTRKPRGKVTVEDLSKLKYGGVLSEEEERILSRAQRFGEVKGGKAKELLDRIEHAKQLELKRKRAERFGTVVAPDLIREVKKVDRQERRERAKEAKRQRQEEARAEAEKKRQRAERFAKPVVPPEEEEKMKKRAERFGA
ncbi:Heteroous nuclear ribonucleoprotein U-like protein 2 [Hondaea fermentalgiana]|uniref:Heteroous nuclear ribonucleoprotein U-like protein 2 n=1 Tax=Hondaea fermentalgiana TaxID=2315210 RepID=A0A2R5G5X5_9STRA|nr:Heteroous nuclear ribonucleoprotein U-like protein 2 [Hondaea fermentalgiana]|eukprot:GBG26462.1 Heteroous nuclear ribonucleoprotein U-like protein 2 [Hondaea fermentalgiana]